MAARDNLIASNPADGATFPGRCRSQSTGCQFLFTGAEIVAASLAAYGGASSYPMMVDLLLWGGLRSEEIRGLQARDVREKTRQLRIEHAVVEPGGISLETTKSTQARLVKLPDGVVTALVDYAAREGLGGDDLLFPRKSGRDPLLMTSGELLRASWHPAMKAAGIEADPGSSSPGRRERPTPRDARATHASWLHSLGWGDLEAMVQMGHSTITLTQDLYAEASSELGHDMVAARLAGDYDLTPGQRLDALFDEWWSEHGQ